MIYESTLEDVDTTFVPYEAAFKGVVSAMVYKTCLRVDTASRIRALMWVGAWHPPTLSWVPYVCTKVLLRQALTLRLGACKVRSETTFLCASEFDLLPRPNRAVYRDAVFCRCSCAAVQRWKCRVRVLRRNPAADPHADR